MQNTLVPDFTLEASTGESINIQGLRGQQVVLYFYPKDNTPGCTTESVNFKDLSADFAAANTLILGISRDSIKSHQNFCQKYALPFALLSDKEETVCTLFDTMKLKNMYGKQVRGIERSTFLIDAEGIIRQEWRKVKVEGHAAQVLAAAQNLHNTGT